MPWEAKRLTPAQVQELWEGWQWRRSRDMEVLAHAVHLLNSSQTRDGISWDHWIASFPGYDQERERYLRETYGLEPPVND